MRRIETEYVTTHKVRFVYHYIAFLGEESIRAAEAAECADEQGALWEYMDTLFANQHGENQGAFGDRYLKAFADGLRLDTLKFNACLDTRRYRDAVLKETQEGRARGVQFTPTFFINGEKIEGLPREGFQQKIEAALSHGG